MHSYRSTLSQITAALIQAWLFMDIGLQIAISALILGALHNKPSEALCLNDEQASWVGSLMFFSHPIGSLLSGYFQELFGRKGSMLLVNIPFFLCWITLYLADSVIQLYIVSLIIGLSSGFVEAPMHSYIGEISEPHIRGILSSMSASSAIFGTLVQYFLGLFFTWRIGALISSSVPVITFICMTQIPESPTWLIMKGRIEEAQKSLCWLRGWVDPSKVQVEFNEMLTNMGAKQSGETVQGAIEAEKEGAKPATESEGYLKTKYKELTDEKVLRSLRLVFITFIFTHATCLAALHPYLIRIYDEMGLSFSSKFILFFSAGCVLIGTLTSVFFVRKFGKRRLALVCQVTATTCIFLLGVYCSFFNRSNSSASVRWIPILLIILIDFCIGFSLFPLPWQLVCEVFPLKGRGAAGGISAAWSYYVGFAFTKTYLLLEHWLQLNGVFFFYGTFSVCGFFYYYYCLPETEGKSLEEIQSYFTDDHDRKKKFSMPRSKK